MDSMKKLLVLTASLIIALSSYSHDFEMEGIYYMITSSTATSPTVTISCKDGLPSSYSGSVDIPESVFYDGTKYSVKGIEGNAFYECENLTSVTIPNSVTIIGSWAFHGCTRLMTLNIPSSVLSIESGAFSGCQGLINVTLHKGLISMGYGIFQGCASLTSIKIPSSVTSIGSGISSGCFNLTSIEVDDENVYYDSRNNCNAIIDKNTNALIAGCKNSVIPNGVMSIADDAFHYCIGLTSITIPNGVTSIGGDAFSGCSNLTSISVPNSVTSIGNYAFRECSSLSKVSLSSNITKISNGLFEHCSVLSDIIIPEKVKIINNYAFAECSKLVSIVIPKEVTRIDDNAFENCSGIKSVTISSKVNSIGLHAFTGCTEISCIYVYIQDPWQFYFMQARETFDHDNGSKAILYVPKGTKTIYKERGWGWFRHIVEFNINKDLPYYDTTSTDDNGATIYYRFINDNTELEVTNGDYQGQITIPDKVNVEGQNYNVSSIGDDAFSGCPDLISVVIPEGITNIGEEAFNDCSGITDIFIYDETPEPFTDQKFDDEVIENATLHVPEGTIEIYEGTDGWEQFQNIVEISTSAVRNIDKSNDEIKVLDCYSIDGKSLSQPQKGLSIIKMSNGTTKKIVK